MTARKGGGGFGVKAYLISAAVITAPLSMVVWSALIDGNRDAMTALWVCGGIVLFLAGGATVLVGQVMSAKMGRSMFEANSNENIALMQALVEANKATTAATKANVRSNVAERPQTGVRVIEGAGVSREMAPPEDVGNSVILSHGVFNSLEN